MSSAEFELSGFSEASRVGADLRAARERLGWGLAGYADALRIRPEYLAALEDGQFDALPGAAYAAGFLRSYGRALGLDADDLVRRYKAEAEAARGSAQDQLAFPVPARERGLPTGAVVLLGALLAVGAYAGWYRLSGEGRLPAEVVPAIPSRLAPLAEQVVPPSAAPADAKPAAVAQDIPEPGDVPQMPAISPSSAAAAIPLPPVPAAVPPPPVMQALLAPAPQSAATPPAPSPDTPRLLLRTHGDAWLQIRDRSGQVLLRKVLKAGESWPVPPRPGLLLNTGNAGNTEIVLDGSQQIALSGAGISRRDLPLDLDLIKDGKLGPPVVMPKPKTLPEAAGMAATPAAR
jgi:cytoskeleton protein RodZ